MANIFQQDIRLIPSTVGGTDINILNGETFTYQINKNLKGLAYDGNPAFVDKQFISDSVVDKDNFISFDNLVVDNDIGDFNDMVRTIEVFELNDIELIAIGGDFTEYNFNGVSTKATFFIILNKDDGTPYKTDDIDYEDILEERGGIGRVNKIKFHESNQSIVMVGRFIAERLDVDCNDLVEFDLVFDEITASNVAFQQRGGLDASTPTGVLSLDIRQDSGTIIIGGGFSEVFNQDARVYFLDYLLETASDTLLNSTKDAFSDDTIRDILVTKTGDFKCIFAGGFDYVSTSGDTSYIVEIDINGVNQNTFKPISVSDGIAANGGPTNFQLGINTVYIQDELLYIGGYFNKYDGVSCSPLIRTDLSGNIDELFLSAFPSQVQDSVSVNTINGYYNNGFSVLFMKSFLDTPGPPGPGGGTPEPDTRTSFGDYRGFDVDGIEVASPSQNDGSPLNEPQLCFGAIYFDNKKLIIGSRFSGVGISTLPISSNQIIVVDDLETTRNNIFDNLVLNNSINSDLGFRYRKLGTDIIRIEKILQAGDIITSSRITSQNDNVVITTNSTVDEVEKTIQRLVVNIPIRKDNYIKNTLSNVWSSASFQLTVFDDEDISITDDNTITVIKQRITDDQRTQYVNISPLINQQSLETNISYYNSLNYGSSFPVINVAKIGKYGNINVKTLLNETILQVTEKLLFITDGFKEYKPVLLNGSKRLFGLNDKITIPFISNRVKTITLSQQGFKANTIFNEGFGIIDPTKPGDFISYVCIDFSQYFIQETTQVVFKNGLGQVLDTITLYKPNTSCIFNPVKIIFKNSYGVLENCYMNGRTNDSISTKSDSFKRDAIDINGNIPIALRHTNKVFNKTGDREWVCNTGLVSDYMNGCYEDLYMSEEVWLEIDGVTRAVSLKDTNFRKKDDTQNDMINYQFTFKEDKKINK